jgi:hypothetical protein
MAPRPTARRASTAATMLGAAGSPGRRSATATSQPSSSARSTCRSPETASNRMVRKVFTGAVGAEPKIYQNPSLWVPIGNW